MYIKEDLIFEELKRRCRSRVIDILEKIEQNDKENELMSYLENYFSDVPSITNINDLLWYKEKEILEHLKIK